MSSGASVSWHGLDEFTRQLRALPAELASEANVVVQTAADTFARDQREAYPEGPTGNLSAGVTVQTQHTSAVGVVARVRSRAKHAYIFERGTVQRRTQTGANRGRMPKAKPDQAFIPRAIRARRRMVSALVEILKRAGLTVEGEV